MTNPTNLTEKVTTYFQSLFPNDEALQLAILILKELAKGEPVEPAHIAKLTGWSTAHTTDLLKSSLPIEWDDQQRVVGMGISLREATPYRFIVNDHHLSVWCAVDALLFPPLIGLPARIESPCFVTEGPIIIDVTPDALQHVQPTDAVMSIVTPQVDISSAHDVRALLCSGNKFFKSAKVAEQYQQEHPEALIIPVTEGYKMFVDVARRLVNEPVELRSSSQKSNSSETC